jgi:heme-degrading monooxygenase HmoA
MATSFVLLPLKPGNGKNADAPDSEEGKAWASTLDVVKAQPGFQRSYWGLGVENPDELYNISDWNSVEDHLKFVSSPEFGEMLGKNRGYLAGKPVSYRVNLKPHPATDALSKSPVTELFTCYFPADITAETKAEFEAVFNRFAEVGKNKAEGITAVAGGWVVEEVEYKDQKSRAFLGVFGWQSVDAHKKYRETDAFKEAVSGGIRDKVIGSDVKHVVLRDS